MSMVSCGIPGKITTNLDFPLPDRRQHYGVCASEIEIMVMMAGGGGAAGVMVMVVGGDGG